MGVAEGRTAFGGGCPGGTGGVTRRPGRTDLGSNGQINREMRDYSESAGRPVGNRPWLSLLAIFPGGLLIIPAMWTLFETAGRIQDTQGIASGGGGDRRISPGFTLVLGLLTAIVYVPFQALHVQGWLNKCWDLARRPSPGGPSLPPLREPARL